MTLQVLRNQVGDRDFFRILRAWAARKSGGNGTTGQFVALAERISGQQLDELFDAWLFTPGKPALGAAAAAAATSLTAAGTPARTPAAAASLLQRLAKEGCGCAGDAGYSRRSIGSRERVSRPAPSIATTGTTSTAMPTLRHGKVIGYGVGAGQMSA